MNNFKYLFIVAIFALVGVVGCSDDYLSVDNINSPDRDEVLSSADDVYSLLGGTTTNLFNNYHSLFNVHINGLADQTTSTNRYLSFWTFTDQPRLKVTNATTWADLVIFSGIWDENSLAISTSNEILNLVNNTDFKLELNDGTDKSNEIALAAYFNRGMAMAGSALIYDQFYIIDENTDLASSEAFTLYSYSEVMAAAIADIERAIAISEANGTGWEFLPTQTFTSDEFVKIANSYIARFMINTPRTSAEASSLDYAAIKAYADRGLDFDFAVPGSETFFANALDWCQYNLSDGAGYLPTDQKLVWMFDPTMPKNYPDDPANNVLPEATTNDARAAAYYGYTTAFGFLNPDRNSSLFSNYYLNRWPLLGEDADYANSTSPFFLQAENMYIQAECMWKMGNTQGAVDIINMSPRNTVGGLTEDASADLEHVLHYEYSVELDYTGQAIQWGYMRRHDLLQTGTHLHYPVPASEMEILQLSPNSYGGVSGADGVNTASGSNSWNF